MAFKPGNAGEPSAFPDGFTNIGMAIFRAGENNDIYSAILHGLKAGHFEVQDLLDLERYAALLKALNFIVLQHRNSQKAEIRRAISDFELQKMIEE